MSRAKKTETTANEVITNDKTTTIDSIGQRMSEITESANAEFELPKGDLLEQEILKETEITEPTINVQQGEPKKETRGRKKGTKNKAKNSSDDFEESQTDLRGIDPIASMVNGTVVPLICTFGIPVVAPNERKQVDKVMLTKEQQDMLMQIAPEDGLPSRSWFMYGATMLGMIMGNFFSAPSDKLRMEVDELKKEMEKIRQEKNPINARKEQPEPIYNAEIIE